MQALKGPLTELAEFEEINKNRMEHPGMLCISGCVNSQKTHMMYALSHGIAHKVIVCSSESKARQVYEEYRMLDTDTYLYPAKDLLFYQADIRSKELVKARMEVLAALIEKKAAVVVASIDAFMDCLLPREVIRERVISIGAEDTVDLEELIRKLVWVGYEREAEISGPGQFAVRGGILDVYPLTEELPIRIELWGDEVDSIRTFDVDTQRSIENLSEVFLYPASEFPTEEDQRVSFLQYFDPKDTLLYLDEPVRILEKGEGVEKEFIEAGKRRVEAGYEVSNEEMKLYGVSEVVKEMNRYCGVGFFTLPMKAKGFEVRGSYDLQTKSVNPYNRSFELLTQDLKRLKRNGYRVVLLSGSRTRARRLAEDLRDYNLSSYYSDDMEREVQPGEIMTAYGHITEGYEYPLLKFTVIAGSK